MNKKILSEKYEIKQEIGRGGMGVIYEALHTPLNRTVAIKILHPQFTGDPAFLKRFQREARAMARLDHINIIRVFDVGQDDGFHYIVMEYFPGKDLKQLILERGTLSQKETLSIALQITKALSYAHAHGIIHRDIKPGNIIVSNTGLVKIADFGIAAATDEVSVTATGHVIGTPEYMSVEQARGEHIDSRSDLYSLGMVIYEMLTGRTSFSGISKMAILGKLVYEKKDFDLTFQDHILPSVQNLVSTLLKKNKEERISDTTTIVNLLKKASSDLQAKMSQAETVEETALTETPLSEGEKPLEIKPAEEEEASLKTVLFHKTPPDTTPVPSASSSISDQESHQKPPEVSDRAKSEQPIISLPKHPPSQSRWPRVITVVAAIALLFTGLGYYLSVMNGGPPTPPAPSPLDEMRTIQKSIREIQTKLTQSHKEADTAEASHWAKELYGKAFDLESRGAKQLDEADTFIKKEQFQAAKTRLQNALSLFGQAHDGFLKAKATAQMNIVQSEKLKTEQEKKAQQKAQTKLERLKQERLKAEAERRKQEVLARAEQEKLKQAKAKAEQKKRDRERAETERQKQETLARAEQEKLKQEKARTEKEKQEREQAEAERQRLSQEKAKAEKEALVRAEREKLKQKKTKVEKEALAENKRAERPSSGADINYLGNSLNSLKAAFEKKDLRRLQKMSRMSPNRAQLLKQIFSNYKTIKVTVTNLSVVGNEAKALISIKELTALDGNRVLPSKRWKDAELIFRKEGEQWGKATW